MAQTCHRVLWAKSHSKKSKFNIIVGDHERCVRQGDHPSCFQRSVQKPACLMVMGCISAHSIGSVLVLEGTMKAERYIKVVEQDMLSWEENSYPFFVQIFVLQQHVTKNQAH